MEEKGPISESRTWAMEMCLNWTIPVAQFWFPVRKQCRSPSVASPQNSKHDSYRRSSANIDD